MRTVIPATPATAARPAPRAKPVAAPTVVYVPYPMVTYGSDGLCKTTGYRAVPPDQKGGAAGMSNAGAFDILTNYPPCPTASPTPARPGGPAQVLAEGFWQQVPLPVPKPYIAPGWATTGMRAFLETRGATTSTFTRASPLGPMRVTATGTYDVDWGDGTRSGPHASEGRPWPDGTITHLYSDVGRYDVVVTENWQADWQVGAQSGRLSGLRTLGRIDDLRVEEIQAVIVR